MEPAPGVLHVYPPLGLPERLLGVRPRMNSAQGYLTLALTRTLTLTLTLTLTRRRLVLTALDAVTVGGYIVLA